jgi:hypothetical protein
LVAARRNLGYCHLQKGELEQGLALYENRERVRQLHFDKPQWTGEEPLMGKSIFVHWEQGLGDTIQFCRYGELLQRRGATVSMSVQSPLYPLLRQLQPLIDVVDQETIPSHFDYHCPLLSLPLAFKTTLELIPAKPKYLNADPVLKAKWEARAPRRSTIRVGMAWRGNADHSNDHNRSLSLSTLEPLCSMDVQLTSLQVAPTRDDLSFLQTRKEIEPLGNQIEDFNDTAAVIDMLDLVVTVDTSVAHLAGAMGKRVWILLPFNADWRWLVGREDSPWYPSARLFRQDSSRDWSKVVQRVAKELAYYLASASKI